MENILVTGSAGFIGFHLCLKLLNNGFNVLGIDNHNSYYDLKLKHNRYKILNKFDNYQHKKTDLIKLGSYFLPINFNSSNIFNISSLSSFMDNIS